MGISSAGLYPAQYADSQGLKTNVNLKTLLKTKDAHGYQPFGFIFMGSQLTSLNLDDLAVQERRLGQGQTVMAAENNKMFARHGGPKSRIQRSKRVGSKLTLTRSKPLWTMKHCRLPMLRGMVVDCLPKFLPRKEKKAVVAQPAD